jgi:beta-lactamase class A
MLTRREWLGLALAAAAAQPALAASSASTLKSIQKRIGGRLGVHVLDTQSGKRIAFNDGERFAMASTFKVPLVAALLWQVDHGAFPLTHELSIDKKDLLANSPILQKAIDVGATSLTVRDLCGAAVSYSDNAAANILLAGMGGPAALTQFLRGLGDEVTRCDRTELELNSNTPGDERDTTTPRAMVETLLKIFTQNVLSLASRALLIDWMIGAHNGTDRVRKGLPKSWQAGDKPGTGGNGAFNDIAIAWPPNRRPILIAAYMSESTKDPKDLAAAHADIGTMVGNEKWK